MICPHCHKQHPDNAQFCPKTGRPILTPPAQSQATVSVQPEPPPPSGHEPQPVQDSVRLPAWSKKQLALAGGVIGIVLIIVVIFIVLRDVESLSMLRERLFSPREDLPLVFLIQTPDNGGAAPEINVSPTLDPAVAEGDQAPTPSTTPRVLDPTVTPTEFPTPTPDPNRSRLRQVVYVSAIDSSGEIFIMDPATGQSRQITHNSYREEAPSFSPDNFRIVYASERNGEWELYIYDLIMNSESKITNFSGKARWPEWSPVPGDERIVFEGRSDDSKITNLYLVNADGTNLTQLTQGDAEFQPSWSPDGQKIVYGHASQDTNADGIVTISDEGDAFYVEVRSGNIHQITNTPGVDEILFSWSPDGDWIALSEVRGDATGNGFVNLDDAKDMYLVRPDGSDHTFVDIKGLAMFSPDWSPDNRLVFSANVGNFTQIWIYNFDTRKLSQITTTGGYYHTEWER